jgi:hypothetical protein
MSTSEIHLTGLASWDDCDLEVTATPARISAGGTVVVTVPVPAGSGSKYKVTWVVEAPTQLSARDSRLVLLGATAITGRELTLGPDIQVLQATLNTDPLPIGASRVGLKLDRISSGEGADRHCLRGVSNTIEVVPKPFAAGDDVAVTMKRTAVPPTSDQALWVSIRNATHALGFENYTRFLEAVICDRPDESFGRLATMRERVRKVDRRNALPFPNVDRYRLLKAATEVFLMTHCGVDLDDFSRVNLNDESRRLNRTVDEGDLQEQMADYLERVAADDGQYLDLVPYLGLIRQQLRDVAIVGAGDEDARAEICYGILAEKLTNPCFLELIHEYWYDEANVAQAMNAVIRRFQNRAASGPGRDPLAGLDVDPLRPLNNLLWGLVQDQQHRLTTVRRAYEYDHSYGLVLSAKPGPPVRGADSRSRFLQAFNNLLSLCSVFYVADDNTMVIADGFGVLNALKETHLLLTEGAHNQYGDLPWTARHEMLMYQWILSRSEMSDFLPTRTMVANPEGWIGSMDAMNKLQGWSDVPVLHFRDLAVFGEQLLLGIRFGAWTTVHEPEQAANWARYWRPEAQGYIHAFRAVTGVDLTQRSERNGSGYEPRQRQRSRANAYRG